MASATNRTERLAKALKESRPDFTLHNARAFARAVIEAPEGVFGTKPLGFLPREQGATASRQSTNGSANDLTAAIQHLPPGGEFFRLNENGPEPVAVADARPGDLVVKPGGGLSLYLGNGRVLDNGADQDDLQRLARATTQGRDVVFEP